MNDEVLRAAVGLPIAVIWPLGLPGVAASRLFRALAAGLTAAFVLAPRFPDWQAFVLVVVAAAVAAALRPTKTTDVTGAPPASLVLAVATALGLALVGGLVLDAGAVGDALDGAVADERMAFVVVGLLGAVFGAGALIGAALAPLADRVRSEAKPSEETATEGLVRAGLYIGWLERSLVFLFVVAGEPSAAALALTAKSVARFPAFARGHEPLAEYVLIGTLASFGLATAAAVGTRALLGLSAL